MGGDNNYWYINPISFFFSSLFLFLDVVLWKNASDCDVFIIQYEKGTTQFRMWHYVVLVKSFTKEHAPLFSFFFGMIACGVTWGTRNYNFKVWNAKNKGLRWWCGNIACCWPFLGHPLYEWKLKKLTSTQVIGFKEANLSLNQSLQQLTF